MTPTFFTHGFLGYTSIFGSKSELFRVKFCDFSRILIGICQILSQNATVGFGNWYLMTPEGCRIFFLYCYLSYGRITWLFHGILYSLVAIFDKIWLKLYRIFIYYDSSDLTARYLMTPGGRRIFSFYCYLSYGRITWLFCGILYSLVAIFSKIWLKWYRIFI